jgi:glycosyltransferase involved in cell wall biosynthesis
MLSIVVSLRGAKMIWTAHNFQRDKVRNSASMEKWFWSWFIRRLDGIIFLNRTSADVLLKSYPKLAHKASVIIPHGHYGPVLNLEHRNRLPETLASIQERPYNIIFFGGITAYKNVWQLVQAFLEIPAGRARLSLLGKMSERVPDKRLLQLLRDLPAERMDAIEFQDRFLPDDCLVERLEAADLVVLPYGDVLNSGAAIFALSTGQALLTTNTPSFLELREQVGREWVQLVKGILDGGQLIAASKNARKLMASGYSPDLRSMEWGPIAERTVEFYIRLST